MKVLGKIGIHFCIVLLALANMAFQPNTIPAKQVKAEHLNAATFSAYSNPLLCLPRQNTGFAFKEVGSSLPKKLLASACIKGSNALNALDVSRSHYFSVSRFILTALEISDIIFPFHYFW